MVATQGSTNGKVAKDDWDLIIPSNDIAAIDLLEVLSMGEEGEDKTQLSHVSIRMLQPTLMNEVDRLRRILNLPVQYVQRRITMHGLALLQETDSYPELKIGMLSWQQKMHETYSNDVVSAMTQRIVISPTGCIERKATISTYPWVHAELNNLAGDTAIQLQYAVQFAMMASFSTLPTGAYRSVARADLSRLKQHIKNRMVLLAAPLRNYSTT